MGGYKTYLVTRRFVVDAENKQDALNEASIFDFEGVFDGLGAELEPKIEEIDRMKRRTSWRKLG